MDKLFIFVVTLQCLLTSNVEGKKVFNPSTYANLRHALEVVLPKLNDDVTKREQSSSSDDVTKREQSSSSYQSDITEVNVKAHTTNQKLPGATWQGGDELVTDEVKAAEDYDNSHPQADDLRNPIKQWPKGSDGRAKVPYYLDVSIAYDSVKVTKINEAIQKFRQLTCIDWVKISDPTSTFHVQFIKGQGCWSYIGKAGPTKKIPKFQRLSIGDGCEALGQVEHEMLHALGFFHTHSRYDRDKHVRVLLENLIDQRYGSNFVKEVITKFTTGGLPYDMDSVMHYSSHAFAKAGTNTLLTVPDWKPFSVQRNGFSSIDVQQVNRYYKCAANARSTAAPPIEKETLKGNVCEHLSSLGLCNRKVVCTFCKPQCGGKGKTTLWYIKDVKGKKNCEFWSSKGYCDAEHRFAQWMAMNCLKSCFAKFHPGEGECRQ